MFAKNDQQNSTKPKFQCQICLHFGHTADRCWKRFNKNWKTPVHKALFALQVTDVDPNEWTPDSGASSHMTGNSYLFISLSKYKGADSVICNGEFLPISNISTVVLPTISGSLQLDNVLLVPTI